MEQENVLTVWEDPKSLKGRIQRMLEIQQNVMKEDVDYGIIPGCKKPSLLKPGAELLMVTFYCSDRLIIEDLSENDLIRYRITTEIYNQPTGVYLGCGVGEASSDQEKHRWRKAVCDEEYEETDSEKKREKWFKADKWNKDPYKVKQIRTHPADLANTVLKMAKKSSKIDGVLSVLAASRIYTQDIEDMSKELQEMMKDTDRPKSSKPEITQPTEPVENATSPGQVSIIQSVSIKTGTDKNKKPYTRYGIKIDGTVYGTFDKKIGEAAEYLCNEKASIGFEWEKSGNFINLTSLWQVDEVPQEPEPDTPLPKGQQKAEEIPSVMPHDVFCKEINGLAKQAGIKNVDAFIKEQMKIEKLDDVTTEKQSTVMTLFQYQVENKRE